MQARLEQQHPRRADGARKVEAEAVIVAGHFRLAAVERRPGAGHQRNVGGDIVPVFVPRRGRIAGREQARHRRRLRGRPGDDDGVVAMEAREAVGRGGDPVQRRPLRRRPGRPRHLPGERGGGRGDVQPDREEAPVRVRRIEIENNVIDIDAARHRPAPPQTLQSTSGLGRISGRNCDAGHTRALFGGRKGPGPAARARPRRRAARPRAPGRRGGGSSDQAQPWPTKAFTAPSAADWSAAQA